MKNLLLICWCLAFAKAVTAQTHPEFEHLSLPGVTQKDAPSTNEVYRVQTVTYKSDSLGYEPVWLNVLNYNDDGLKFQHYDKSIGKYASETLKEYYYTGKRLDSMVKRTSAAAFNLTSYFEYDNQNRMVKEKAKGKYPYQHIFTYKKNTDLVESVKLVPAKGEIIQATFNYNMDGSLNKVTEITFKSDSKEVKKEFTVYYAKGIPFARTTEGFPLISVVDFTGVYKIRSAKDKNETIKDLRNAALESDMALFQMRKELAKDTNMIEQYMTSTDNRTNDWTKRHKTGRSFGKNSESFLFRKLYYPDSTTSGSTEFDRLFEMKVPRKK
jgi:hypothetical protein